MRGLACILVALFALALVPTAHGEGTNACRRMQLYVVTGHKVEPQFRVYAGRLVGDGASCRLARSVVRAFNRRQLTTKRRVSVRVSGRRWDCLWSPDSGTSEFKSQCDRAAARVIGRQPAILDERIGG
jgi:hypothetical protein